MARDQQTDGTYKPLHLGASAVGETIKVSSTSLRGLDDLAKNVNSNWANRSPSLVSQVCPGGSNIRHVTVDSDSSTVYWYWVLPAEEYYPRDQLTGRIQYYTEDVDTDVGVTVDVMNPAFATVSDTSYTTLDGTTTPTWADLEPLDMDSAYPYNVVRVSVKRADGTGKIYLRGVNFHIAQHAGELPADVFDTGFEALDTDQFSADACLTPEKVGKVATNNEVLFKQYSPPYSVHSTNLQGTKGNGYTSNDTSEFVTVLGPITIQPQRGEGIEEIRYFVLPKVDGYSAFLRLVVTDQDGALLENLSDMTTELSGTPDPDDIGDWITGTFRINSNLSAPTYVYLQILMDEPGRCGVVSWAFYGEIRE